MWRVSFYPGPHTVICLGCCSTISPQENTRWMQRIRLVIVLLDRDEWCVCKCKFYLSLSLEVEDWEGHFWWIMFVDRCGGWRWFVIRRRSGVARRQELQEISYFEKNTPELFQTWCNYDTAPHLYYVLIAFFMTLCNNSTTSIWTIPMYQYYCHVTWHHLEKHTSFHVSQEK